MIKFCGIAGKFNTDFDLDSFLSSINLKSNREICTRRDSHFFTGTSFLFNSPIKSEKIYESKDSIVSFA